MEALRSRGLNWFMTLLYDNKETPDHAATPDA